MIIRRPVNVVLALIMLLNISLLSGCNSNLENNLSNKTAVLQVEVENRPLQPVSNKAMQAPISEAAFAFALGQKLLAEQKTNDNFVYSPLSIWLPLAALVNATDEANKPALLESLGASSITENQINEYAQAILYRITGERFKDYPDYISPFKIANALFVKQGEKVKQSFAQGFADNYLGTIFSVDFSSKQAVDKVNKWASDHTDGLITNIIDEFVPDIVAAIANSVYCSCRWSLEFNENETKSDVFHTAIGDTTAAYMKRKGDGQPYYEDDRVQAMPLSIRDDSCLWILLPKNETANELYISLTDNYFSELSLNRTNRTGTLLLPKFEIANNLELKDALIAIGIPLFDRQEAPLTGGLIESSLPVWLEDAVQKATIKVDEKGTTAAAVTVLEFPLGGEGRHTTSPFEMVCNKPFVFILENYGQILFTGVVNNPANVTKP